LTPLKNLKIFEITNYFGYKKLFFHWRSSLHVIASLFLPVIASPFFLVIVSLFLPVIARSEATKQTHPTFHLVIVNRFCIFSYNLKGYPTITSIFVRSASFNFKRMRYKWRKNFFTFYRYCFLTFRCNFFIFISTLYC
jgi:hypothetical protein